MNETLSQQPIRVGFLYGENAGWTAGLHYLQNLFAALALVDDGQRSQPVVIFENASSQDTRVFFRPYVEHFLVHPPAPSWPGFWRRQEIRLRQWLGVWREPEHCLGPFLRQHQVAAIFARTHFGPNFDVPLLAWIPDFQHLHLPEMFSADEVIARNNMFTQIAQFAPRIIVSSQDVCKDFQAFAPFMAEKVRILSFVANVPREIFHTEPTWVCRQYNLPERFFYLPNQFWKHKNHMLVLDALQILKRRGVPVTVICTGNTNDYRQPGYFAQLLAVISERGLRDNFIILGMVPHKTTLHLMRQALAVLQPSLFEGWSTTVEEVKSVGKSIVLSDIPVHREQDPPQALYFHPADPEDLAGQLEEVWNALLPGPDKPLEQVSQQSLPSRMLRFGTEFASIVGEVVAGCQ